MYFYQIQIVQKPKEKTEENVRKEEEELPFVDKRRSRRFHGEVDENGVELGKECEKYSQRLKRNGKFFLSEYSDSKNYFGLIIKKPIDVENFVMEFAKEHMDVKKIEVEEVTFQRMAYRILREADRNDFIEDADRTIQELGLRNMPSRDDDWFDEGILQPESKERIFEEAESLSNRETLLPELERIYSMPQKKFMGQPVHYLIETDDYTLRDKTTDLLLAALEDAGRIRHRRYSTVDSEMFSRWGVTNEMRAIYDNAEGGTVLTYLLEDDFATEEANTYLNGVEEVTEVASRHRTEVLSIFILPRSCNNLKDKIFSQMSGATFVELYEEMVMGEKITAYLKSKASERKARIDKNLTGRVDLDKQYLPAELNEIFEDWYAQKLKVSIFPQYSQMQSASKNLKEQKPKGSAYSQLQQMIGLTEAKRVIDQALNSRKAENLFKNRGMNCESMSMHMVFTGNPGTAKTSVARLFAQIMKENGLVSKGQFIECGRGDLVGKFVGWTAPNIQKKFREAEGGVLFIDEAYSLVDDRGGSYGDEAINTIVQEMENHREDLVVIFAGYPDKMEEFLQRNPGLRSRIAFHIDFEDYTAEELCQIGDLIAEQKGVCLSAEAREKMLGLMEKARAQKDFGNGRYARNVIEKAKMAQQCRLVKMDAEKVTAEDLKTILPEDIEEPRAMKNTAREIGFAV